MAPLGQSERLRVNDTVGPEITSLLKPVGKEPHRATAIQLEHKRYVLQKNPAYFTRRVFDEPEQLAHETGLPAPDSGCSAGLAEILAGEPSRNEVHCRERP